MIEPDLSDGRPIAPSQAASQPVPRTLPQEPAGRPISAEKAAFVEQAGAPQQAATKPADAQQPPPEEPARPWIVLALVALGLFASLGGNVYLGWIAWDFRQRLVLRNAVS